MASSHRILQLVAVTDMLLAIAISSYLGFQIRHGAKLIPGSNLSEAEKVTRLVVYAALIYVILGIQLYMAIQLLKTAGWVKIMETPLKSLRKIGMWLEWSFVYLIFIALHGATALLLMKPGQRKSIILAISSVQVIFRLSGILITSKYQYIISPSALIKV